MVALLLALAFAVAGRSSSAAAAGTAPTTRHAVVQPGQTLWSIAAAALPELDPREAVQQISDLNGIAAGASLTPGQAVVLPVAD
jgi:hypothetical protein